MVKWSCFRWDWRTSLRRGGGRRCWGMELVPARVEAASGGARRGHRVSAAAAPWARTLAPAPPPPWAPPRPPPPPWRPPAPAASCCSGRAPLRASARRVGVGTGSRPAVAGSAAGHQPAPVRCLGRGSAPPQWRQGGGRGRWGGGRICGSWNYGTRAHPL